MIYRIGKITKRRLFILLNHEVINFGVLIVIYRLFQFLVTFNIAQVDRPSAHRPASRVALAFLNRGCVPFLPSRQLALRPFLSGKGLLQ